MHHAGLLVAPSLPPATCCRSETEGETRVWAGRVRRNGQQQMSPRANQLATYVCVYVRPRYNTNALRADACTHTPHLARKNTRTHRSESHPSPLPSKDHLDSATALTVASWDEMLPHLFIFCFVSFFSIYSLIIKNNYVLLCANENTLCVTSQRAWSNPSHKKKKKRLLEELESFVFLHCHTNMRSKTYHSVQNKG